MTGAIDARLTPLSPENKYNNKMLKGISMKLKYPAVLIFCIAVLFFIRELAENIEITYADISGRWNVKRYGYS
jgi:hypothetical protein